MKLAIIGYGKMGRLIEQLAPEYGFTSVVTIDIGDDIAKATGVDVAIEFTAPEAVLGNIEKLAAMKLPVVVGTTGWLNYMDQARATVEKNGSALVWSPNFSIGVNVFLRVLARPPDCWRMKKNMAPGLGRFITTPRRMRHQAP